MCVFFDSVRIKIILVVLSTFDAEKLVIPYEDCIDF